MVSFQNQRDRMQQITVETNIICSNSNPLYVSIIAYAKGIIKPIYIQQIYNNNDSDYCFRTTVV